MGRLGAFRIVENLIHGGHQLQCYSGNTTYLLDVMLPDKKDTHSW
jgi:hypothetical protein